MMMLRYLTCAVWIGISGAAFAQDDSGELARIHAEATAAVKNIVSRAVAPALDDLGSSSIPDLGQAEIEALLAAMQDAEFLHSQLSPQSTYSAPVREPQSVWECRQIPQWVCVRDGCGRCYWRCELRFMWVRVEQTPQQYQAPVVSRRPLRDNIARLLQYLNQRRTGDLPADLRKDRSAALQVLSVLLNLDPNFSPGEVRAS